MSSSVSRRRRRTRTAANLKDRPRVLFALRSLGADVDQLPEIPEELADYIAWLPREELERMGLLPKRQVRP